MTREEAINAITQFIENYAYGNDLIGLKMAIETLKEERPHGEWIPQDKFSAYYKCSNCGIMIDNDFPIWRNFCPNCGASMSANDRQVK